MPFPQLVIPPSGGGVTTVADWASLPTSPTDGDYALVLDAQIAAVAKDGVWLPDALVGGVTLTRDADASFDLDDALADLTGRGWTAANVTKTAGNPLTISGAWNVSYAEFLRGFNDLVLRIDYEGVSGEGVTFVTNLGPTKRVDHFYGATEARRVNSARTTQDGHYTTAGPVFIRLTTTQMAWWCPGSTEVGVLSFNQLATADLEGFTSALYSGILGLYGAYSGSATWKINRLDLWEVT